jgi:hypothetical protein
MSAKYDGQPHGHELDMSNIDTKDGRTR